MRLVRALQRLLQRLGDRWWALFEPVTSKLLAVQRRLINWRRSRGDALWAAGEAVRERWRHTTQRRRATIAALVVLPISMVAAVTSMLLPVGHDPQRVRAQVRMGADAPQQEDRKPVSATRDTRADSGREPARDAGRAYGGKSPAAAAAPAPSQAGGGGGESQFGGGYETGLGSGGRDSSANHNTGSPGAMGESPSRSAPSPRTRSPRALTFDDRGRPQAPRTFDDHGRPYAPSPGPPAGETPAPQRPAPEAEAPAPPPPPPPVIEQAPAVTETESEVDPGDSKGRGHGSPPGHGGGNDKDKDP
jgi:hypothetical protein